MTARGPSLAAGMRWLLRARPADYMLALSVAGASLPVVGKSLEPLGGVTAMGWPRHITDVKTVIMWARANVDKFGGDRNFIAVAGCSAGGHLAALAGLSGNDPHYQAELPEGSDTSFDAVVGIYGRYNWEDRSTPERVRFVDFLQRVVVNRTVARHPEVFRNASPIARMHRNAPPFLVIHGSKDTVIPVEQARSFVERLRTVSHSLVGYLELPGAGHGFDLAHATSLFLNQVHRSQKIGAKEVI
jgi:acetyl esterase/lipase